MLASSSIDETVKVWDANAGRELHTFRPGAMARDLAFSHDETYLAVAGFTKVILLKTSDWSEAGRYDGWNAYGVRFHPGKNELYYFSQRRGSTGEDPLKVYAVTLPGGSPRLLATVERTSDRTIPQLDLAPDGKTLLLVQANTAHLIPTRGGSPSAFPLARRFTPDGDLFLIEETDNSVSFGVKKLNGELRWELATNANEVANDHLVHTMAFSSATGTFYWANREGMLALGNYRTGEPSMRRLPEGMDIAVATGANDQLYLSGKQPVKIYAYDPVSITQRYAIGEEVLVPAQLAGSEATNRLSWGRSGLATLEFRDRQVIPYTGPAGSFSSGRALYADKSALLAASSGTADVFSYQLPGRHPEVKRYKSGFADARTVAPNATGNRLAVIGEEGYLIMSTETDKSVASGKLTEGDAYFNDEAALSPTADRLLLSVSRYTGTGRQTESYARLVNTTTGETIWQQKGRLDAPTFSVDGTRIHAQIFENFADFNAADGREIKRHRLPPVRFPSETSFNARRDWATYVHDNRAYLYDLARDRELQLTVPGEDIPFERSAFFNDDFVALAGREGILRVFDLRTKAYVAAIVRYAASDDWAIVSPDGRFDATPGAMRKMYYRIGRQQIALEQLFTGFYVPGLAHAIFNRLPLGDLPAPININQLRPAPEVKIDYQPGEGRNLIVEDDPPEEASEINTRVPEAIITVRASAPGDRVGELRLYRNDKLLGGNARGLIVEDDTPDPAATTEERRYRVRLLPGVNAFRAVALNGQATESRPAYLTVSFTPSTPASNAPVNQVPGNNPTETGPAAVTLHLVTVGIDRYANPEFNLNYAGADASSMDLKLGRDLQPFVGKVRRYVIRDADATRANILQQLKGIVSTADADDVFVFYFAGHGMVPDPESGEFYLIPHDVTATSALGRGGISATELRDLSAAVSAQRQLFLLDACQSGGAISALTESSAERKAIASLARTTGTHWLTATDSGQLAGEFDELGHGAFTYVLLQGLSGEAGTAGQDLTVDGLKRYLERALPELTARYRGQPQYPSSYGYGPDFRVQRR
jgi:hypothetical protein